VTWRLYGEIGGDMGRGCFPDCDCAFPEVITVAMLDELLSDRAMLIG
jgi:hypothetical protein